MIGAIDKENLLWWADRCGRWGVGLFFLAAAVPKLFDIPGFAALIGAYGMLPKPLLLPVAAILPPVEIFLALGLMRNRLHGKIGIVLLLLLFIAVLSFAIALGLDIDCGCFGPDEPESRAFHGLKTALARDIVMLLPLGYTLWRHRSCQTIKFQREQGK